MVPSRNYRGTWDGGGAYGWTTAGSGRPGTGQGGLPSVACKSWPGDHLGLGIPGQPLVAASEPVVTQWDEDAPERTPRPVGHWQVTPQDDGIHVEGADLASQEIPNLQLRQQMIEEAERTGAPVTARRRVKYDHDIDTGETSHTVKQPATAGQIARLAQSAGSKGSPSAQAQQIARQLQQNRPKPNRSRRSGGRSREKEKATQLPEVVITTEPARRGGFF